MTVRTWNGGGTDANASTSANWGATGVPTVGDDVHFAGSTRTTVNWDLTADISINSITFDSGAGNFILNGNRLTIVAGVTDSSGGTQRINLAIILSGTPTITVYGPINICGVISGTGSITFTGAANASIHSTCTYTGSTTLTGGVTLYIGGSAASGNDGDISTTSGIAIGSTSALRMYNGTNAATYPCVISGSGSVIKYNAGALTLTAANTNSGTWTIDTTGFTLGNGGVTGSLNPACTINFTTSPTLTFNRSNTVTQGTDFPAAISGAGVTVTQVGSGDLVLSGTNTYTGATNCNAGRVIITGSVAGAVAVASGGTLCGTGSIAGATTVASGGSIGPDLAGSTRGTLTVHALTLASGAGYKVDLDGAGPTFDKTNSAASTTNLASATLTVSSITNSVNGKIYTIVGAGTVSNAFNGLANNATFVVNGRTLKIVYTGTTVTLSDATPAPKYDYANLMPLLTAA